MISPPLCAEETLGNYRLSGTIADDERAALLSHWPHLASVLRALAVAWSSVLPAHLPKASGTSGVTALLDRRFFVHRQPSTAASWILQAHAWALRSRLPAPVMWRLTQHDDVRPGEWFCLPATLHTWLRLFASGTPPLIYPWRLRWSHDRALAFSGPWHAIEELPADGPAFVAVDGWIPTWQEERLPRLHRDQCAGRASGYARLPCVPVPLFSGEVMFAGSEL